MSLHEGIRLSSLWIAVIAPFFLVRRWEGGGFILSIAIGWWGHLLVQFLFPGDELIEAVFAGIWLSLGWLFMLIWCVIVLIIVSAFRWIAGRTRTHLENPDSGISPSPE